MVIIVVIVSGKNEKEEYTLINISEDIFRLRVQLPF